MTDRTGSGVSAVLFDFGGVFTESPFAHLQEAARERGLDVEELAGIVFGPYHEDTDHPWHRLERGEVSAGDAGREIVALAALSGVELDPWELLLGMASAGTRQFMVDVAISARDRGCRLAIVTNNIAEFGDHWKKMIPLEVFDVVVDSSSEGVRKPDHRIFHLALERLGVAPGEAAFLDDAPSNVAAARAVGIRSFQVPFDASGAEEVAHQLLALLDGNGIVP